MSEVEEGELSCRNRVAFSRRGEPEGSCIFECGVSEPRWSVLVGCLMVVGGVESITFVWESEGRVESGGAKAEVVFCYYGGARDGVVEEFFFQRQGGEAGVPEGEPEGGMVEDGGRQERGD